VPRAQLACGSVGDDGDGMVVQPGRPALRLLSGPAVCMGRQMVRLHGAGNRSPTRRGGGVRATCHGPRPSRSRGELTRGGDLSCEAESCRARRRLVGGVPLVGNWSEMLPTSREHDVLPVRVSHPILQGKPNASHVCARIILHTHDRQNESNTIAVINRSRVKPVRYSLLHPERWTRRSEHNDN
jgi:hypothetical protein